MQVTSRKKKRKLSTNNGSDYIKKVRTILSLFCAVVVFFDFYMMIAVSSTPLWIAIIMLLGGLILSIANIPYLNKYILLPIIALILIIISSFFNALHLGDINWIAQIIRITISTIIIYLLTK